MLKLSHDPGPGINVCPYHTSRTYPFPARLALSQVRDQRVKLSHDAGLGMMAETVDKRQMRQQQAAQQGRGGHGGEGSGAGEQQMQFVLSWSLADWEHMRTIVSPGDCRMKHR